MHINNNEPPINEGASTSRGSSGTESSGLLNVAEVAGGMRRSASKLLVWKSGKKESTSVGSSKNSSQDSGILLNKEDIGYIYDHIIQEIKEGKCEIWDDNFNQLVEKVLDDVDRKAREKLRQDRWNITSDDGSSLLTVAIERAEQNKDDDEYDIHIWNTIFLIHHYFQTNKTELIKGLKNFTNNQGKTLLHYAIESGNNEFLGAVINGLRSSISHDIKKEIDSKDENGKTPLHYAAELGNKEFFKLLVENGARFTDTIHCNSELHYATESGKLDLLEYIKERLTKRGLFESEKSKKDANGDNALHYAAQSGSGECIKFLIDNCVQFSRNKHDENPLHRIANAKTVDEKAIDYFINDLKLAGRLRSAINRQDKDGNTPLHRAAECGNKLFIEKLIHLDADISIKNNKNNTPLHRAIIKGHSDCVRVFFDSYERSGKIIQETEGGYGRGLVHLAAMYGQYDCLEFLLGKFSNYDTNKETDLGNTALHLAVSGEGDKSLPDTEVQHRKACINLLIKKGTEVNRLNNEGNTPLHLAARFSDSRAELLKCVISNIRKKKIDLNNEIFHKNNDGDNAFHMAAHSGNRACLKYFFTHVKKNKNNKIPEILNKKNYKGKTLLHLAAKSGNTECVEFLQNEAEAVWGNFYCPNRYNLDKIQKEILFSSALSGNKECINKIAGIFDGLTGPDVFDNTILHMAAIAGSSECFRHICQKIKEIPDDYGYNTSAHVEFMPNKNQLTPLHSAAICLNAEVIEYITDKSKGRHEYGLYNSLNKLINSKSRSGKTPLHYIVMNDNEFENEGCDLGDNYLKDIAREKRKKNQHLIEKAIITLLDIAKENEEINFDIKDNQGKTALDYALSSDDENIIKPFLNAFYELKKKLEKNVLDLKKEI